MYNGTISNTSICTEISVTNTSTILNSHTNGQNEFEPEVNVAYVYNFVFEYLITLYAVIQN